MKYEISEYIENGRSPFARWFRKLAPVAAARVDNYLRRMANGNLGDSKSVGGGVVELRINYGPGYRVYFGRDGAKLIILLAGGSKRSQSRDILTAKDHWARYKKETEMALTRAYQQTVLERIKRDPEFTAALYAEAITSLLEGDKETALSTLRDLVHAHISFKTLSEHTGFNEKALHRMLGSKGNPTLENLTKLIRAIEEDLQLETRVEAHWNKPKRRSSRQRDVVLAYA